MQHYIRYQTSTHDEAHGPYETLQAARDHMASDYNWYRARNGTIVVASDSESATATDDVIEHHSELPAQMSAEWREEHAA